MILKTRTKIFGARILYQVISRLRRLAGGSDTVIVKRGGLNWRLTLTEGIDLAIYLFGAFERTTRDALRAAARPGDVVLDLGANIGAHTLPLAEAVGEGGRVYSFEPTRFAFQKLLQNIQLNPDLEARVQAEQAFLVADRDSAIPDSVYSSWPLTPNENLHEKHLGLPQPTLGAYSVTLDDYIEARALQRVDLVKLDVDGNELTVLQGARATLIKFRPPIVMEVSPYVHGEHDHSFDKLIQLLIDCGYSHVELPSGQQIPLEAKTLEQIVPDGAGINCFVRANLSRR